ncbi:unnamed protein product [Rotaria sordida]|uniref:Uncharacterized protein n=1 Tax=Rotaria sordida TaxID=392033 RepID=A0A819L249_9BILA|nr:unnamed protein product [Rotaria sordida]
MSSTKPSRFHSKKQNSKNKCRLHLHHLHTHIHEKTVQHFLNGRTNQSGNSEQSQSSKNLTEQELQQRQLIHQYIFSQLATYANKPRIWQLTHSLHIRRHLLNKSKHISKLYSLSDDFVCESINQLFTNVDKYVSQLCQLMQYKIGASGESHVLFQKIRISNNQWCSLQLKRAHQIFPNINNEEFTDNEILEKYYNHIIETLTPKPDTTSSNCIAQLREQPFDLNHAYEQAENKAKECLAPMLQNYRKRSIPDLELIQEMINLGLEYMKTSPRSEDFRNATNFLDKISMFHKTKEAYESNLHNMSDDFMLLRFGKVFGPNALPTTARSNAQFMYLVHLFIKSILHLIIMMRAKSDNNEEIPSIIKLVFGDVFSTEINSSIIKLNNDDLFSPKLNIDQWTWLLEKWHDALRTFPILLTEVGAFGRLLRTTIGIGIARLFNFAETIIDNNQMLDLAFMNEQLFQALQMGFYFGIAYGIVDCLQDEIQNSKKNPAQHLELFKTETNENENLTKPVEILDKWTLIMEELLRGGEFNRNEIPKTPWTQLLIETFDSLVTLTKTIGATSTAFNELALLLRSQRLDKKTMENFYNDEELFLGAMLKSHFTYTCTTFLGNVKSAREESERLWIMPFLGQLTDDCRDFYDDFQSNSVTPYTHYASFIRRQQSSDKHLLNPFYAFLHLCSDIYLSSDRDIQTGAFIGRRILRTLKSIEISSGQSALREFLYLFCHNNLSLHDYFLTNLRNYFPKVSDPEKSFFRMINKVSIKYARTNRKLETYVGDHLQQIENALHIDSFNKNKKSLSIINRDEELLISAMNYSVTAGGKRLRPLLMMMISDLFNLELKSILPLACGLEYLHTSSLILDDLPAQDNSDLRRGRPTLHKTSINNDIPENLFEGRAQLTAVDLIAISMRLINHGLVQNGFSSQRVNQVVDEISLSMHDLCIGQMMDLRAAHMGIEKENELVDELDHIAWFKTGKALEIVLVTPAILAISSSTVNNQSIDLNKIRELGRLMGILFQMRDDLLDVEGENIGKPIAIDIKNNTVTYVSILGIEGTRQRLKEFRQKTLNLINECWPSNAGTIKDVVNYIVNREN